MKAQAWFLARTPRERVLIAVAAVLCLCLALWFASTAGRQARSATMGDWRSAQLTQDAMQRLTLEGRRGPLTELVQAHAAQAGVSVEVAEIEGRTTLIVATASTPALLSFLARLDADGLAPLSFTIVENADATLQMAATLPADSGGPA